jgi:hypothetical protein
MAFTGAMVDRCRVLSHTAATTGPDPISTYIAGAEIRCRYSRAVEGREVVDGSQMTPTDVTIRVPRGTTVTSSDRIRLTKEHGAVVSLDYAIVGEPYVSPGQIVLACQHVTAGSDL